MTTAVFCGIWVLWPLVAVPGGLGFGVLAGLAAILVLPTSLKSWQPRWYMIPLLGLFVYAAWSTTWSPLHTPLVDINPQKGAFNIRSDVLRIAPLFLATGLLIGAAATRNPAQRKLINRFARWSLLVHLTIVAFATMFQTQLITWIGTLGPNQDETVQNLARNVLIMAISGPVLIGLITDTRSLRPAVPGILVMATIEGGLLFLQDVEAGLLSLAAAAAAVILIGLFPKNGFKLMGAILAIVILAAPYMFGWLSRDANALTANSTTSLRLAIWKRALAVVWENPVMGSGVGVLRTIREAIPSGPSAGVLTIPNHPHNMSIQLWAELGAVGAGLFALAIFLAAWRMPAPRTLQRGGQIAAGLIGASIPIFLVSFDLWNPFFWAVIGLLAIPSATALPIAEEKLRGGGITFGSRTVPVAAEPPPS